MNILYFTLEDFTSIDNHHSINTDLLREFKRHGHVVYAISPVEKRNGSETRVIKENGSVILKPIIGNMQKTRSCIEKGINTLTIGHVLKKAIKKHMKNVKFDLLLYCTPPITFLSAVEYVKKRDGAKTYLLLKDIFPQNAVDLGMMSKKGLKGIIYRYFRRQEKRLYAISDRIGCMSQANVDYVLKHNPEINSKKVEVCPNCIEVIDKSIDEETKIAIRKKYVLPLDKKVFIYGGNLGKPQDVPFIIDCLRACVDLDCYFLIVGSGTDWHLLEEYAEQEHPVNLTMIPYLPSNEYEKLVAACDVGLIFLDHRFTIPNFPSRLLSYMSAKIPVLACTDRVSDVGKVITENGFGWWCESDDAKGFRSLVEDIIAEKSLKRYSELSFKYLEEFSSDKSFKKVALFEIKGAALL